MAKSKCWQRPINTRKVYRLFPDREELQEYDDSTVLMSSKFGQRYECNLPERTPDQLSIQQESAVESRKITELLESMKSSSCLTKVRDWWTYRFCFGEEITQFHFEEGKGIIEPVMSLGRFDSDFDWDNSTELSPNRKLRYHSQIYSNGTKCELNGELRQTEVRFICNEQNTHYFAKIDEPSSCQYVAEIHTDMICKHPYTKSPRKKKPKQISCSPVLNNADYESHKQQEDGLKDEKRKKADEKKSEWLAHEKNKLNKLKKLEEKFASIKSNDENQEQSSIKQVSAEDSNLQDGVEKESDESKDIDLDKIILSESKNEKQTIKKFLVAQLEKIKLQNMKNSQAIKKQTDSLVSESGIENPADDSLIKPQKNSDTTSYTNDDLLSRNKKEIENDDLQIESAQTNPGAASVNPVSDYSGYESPLKDDEDSINKEFENSYKDKVDNNLAQKVKIKIIRVKDDSEIEEWSDQTSINAANFGYKTIVAYVQSDGVTDSLNEMIKQQEIEQNYRFLYNKKKKKE
ncbi:Protein OS-9 [Nymphon striatum]|nr:Protein OS-9 [Nymphon striatum]